MPFGVATRAISNSEAQDRFKAKRRAIERRPCADPKRRARLEKKPDKWLMHYMGRRCFPNPFSAAHLAIISETLAAAETGTGAAVAAPRGEGKTTVCRGVTVYLLATRRLTFPVLVGWKHRDAKAALKLWLRMVSESDEFKADYPELTQPFEITTHAAALKNLTWADTGRKIGATVDIADGMIVFPDSIGAVASRSAQGDAKGLNATMPDGTVVRPDFILFDDTQDPKRADRPAAVSDTIDVLENVFLGMAGPQRRLTAAAACTIEAEDDVSCHFLSRPGWRSVRVARIEQWPGGGSGGDWPDEKHPAKALWDEWNDVRLDQGEKAAIALYKANKAAMTDGMVVSWKERYDRTRGDPDAFYAAMWDRYDKGASVFSRGQQNQPIKEGITLYNLTPAVITARTDPGRAPGDIPDWALRILAQTDINPSYALTTAIIAFGADQRAAVLWYGLHPMHVPQEWTDAEKKTAVMAELAAHGRHIAGLPCAPHNWMIDGGGSPENTVIDFASASVRTCGIPAITAFGRAGKAYRHPLRKEKGIDVKEQAYIKTVSMRWDEALKRNVPSRQWVIFNADYWREQAQRGWTGTLGAPGSCDLPKGRHDGFAEQICAEQLAGKVMLNDRWVYDWRTDRATPHDYGDCMTMGYAHAAVMGIGTGGAGVAQRPQRKRYTQAQLTGGR
jgi:hypothetical protein